MKIQVFQSNGVNGTPDWHVEGTDSFSFYIGTYDRAGKQQLIKAAIQKLKQKNLADWAADKELQIRSTDLAKTVG